MSKHMKTKDEISPIHRPTFYAVLYPDFKKAANDCGYALALHGSMASDMDLISVAWTEDALPVETLVAKISDCIGNTVWKDHHLKSGENKPHGRITYTLSIMGDWYIDLSIIPPSTEIQSLKAEIQRLKEEIKRLSGNPVNDNPASF